ncbi:ribosome silencing factor [Paraburkholderia denitrificans]|uniref:Ribosomal silencing factor RsfS n=1 Tax=Paraburkholderia denitrificans TaxID=694025 RepID=A0ABW0JBK2_9BURK
MDIRKLQRAIVDGLEDVKAQDIKVFNTSHLTELFDRVIVASGTSNRQTKALANSVREKVKEAGGDIVSTEGEDIGEWVLVDCGDAVVHILQPALRQYYNLEEIWGDKPVRLKLASVGGFSGAQPSEPMDDEDEDDIGHAAPAAAKKPAGKKPVQKVVKQAAAKTAAKPAARKTAAKPAAARPAAARPGAPARKSPARRSAAK